MITSGRSGRPTAEEIITVSTVSAAISHGTDLARSGRPEKSVYARSLGTWFMSPTEA